MPSKKLSIRKILLYGTTAVVSFIVLIVVYAPANVAFRLLGDEISKVPDTSIYRISGTVWRGSADIQFRDFPVSEISWQLTPWPLLQGVADLDLLAVGLGHEFSADLTAGLEGTDRTGQVRQLTGTLNSDYVNQVGDQHGLRFSGDLQFHGIDLTIENSWVSEISGGLHWTGGQMRYQLENGNQAVNLPPLDGELSIDEGKLTLNVTHERLPVLSFVLVRSGWVTLRFRARILDLAGLSGPAGSDLDDIVFTIEEKIL